MGPDLKKQEEFSFNLNYFMSRYRGPKEKISRRLGVNLMLKPERSASQKSAFLRKPYPPGIRGKRRKRAISDYGIRLNEKQKVRYTYGLTEKQLRRYFKQAQKFKGDTGLRIIQKLEQRLDNVIYRLGLAPSRAAARQMVSHGHFTVNGRRITIPSQEVKIGDIIGVRQGSRKIIPLKNIANQLKKKEIPNWLEFDREKLIAKVKALPDPQEIVTPFNMQYIVEFYSRG